MIKDMKALSMAEAGKYIENDETKGFIKKFVKMKPDEAEKLRQDIEKLGNIKIKDENIAKIIDLMPEDSLDIAKIFTETSLDENETSQILEIVKKYR
jgi:DNA-directed RNA polymerase subunit F